MADFSDDRKPCAFCGKVIETRAVRCMHCWKEVKPADEGKGWSKKASLLVGVLLMLGGFGLHYATSQLQPSDDPKSHAYSLKDLDNRLNSEPTADPEPAVNDQNQSDEQALNGSIDEWTRTIAKNPKNAGAYLERGWAYNSLGQYESASADLTKAIKLNPKFSDAYAKRAWVDDTLGDYPKAVKDATRAVQLDPNNTEAYEARASAYANLGETEKAEADSSKSSHPQLK